MEHARQADVAHGRLHVLVAAPGHDDLRGLAADGQPGRRRRPEVVPGDLLRGRRGLVELRALDAGPEEVLPQPGREIAERWHLDEQRPPRRARLGDEGLEQRHDVRLDRDAARVVRLRLLHRAAVVPVDGAVDVDRAVREVDVVDVEGLELAGAAVEVDLHRHEPAPPNGHALARHEGEELAGVDELLPPRGALVGRPHLLRRVVLPDAQLERLRAGRVVEGLRGEPPDVAGRLPGELSPADGLVEALDEPLEVLGRDGHHVQRAELRLDPLRPAAAVRAHRGEAAPLALVEPGLAPLGDGGPLGLLGARWRAGLRRALALGEL
nr:MULTISPECIES: hypothetical protein [Sorangium]